ncbi:MAG: hypothetical protein K2X35_04120 [Bryobacteraceae bacterium]|nr:hypothetical protein [Bryobacteraceae bacterium]
MRVFFLLAPAVLLAQQPVAMIRGTAILPAELDPDPRTLEMFQRDPATLGRSVAQYRSSKLAGRIWGVLREEYCRANGCLPTDEDLQAFQEASVRMEQERRVRDAARLKELEHLIAAAPPDRRAKLEEERRVLASADQALRGSNPRGDRRMAEMWVAPWKFYRALYRQYGGRVIFQQAGPEPLHAMTKFLEEHEAAGAFAIYDPELRQAFWAYYRTVGHNHMPDGGKFLETPWWLQPRPAGVR